MAKPDFTKRVSDLKKRGQYRTLYSPEEPSLLSMKRGREYLNFCSNDYLNLSRDCRLIEAGKRGAEKWGCGATGSRLMSGDRERYHELENSLANFFGYPSATLFGSGFLANLGVLTALAESGDTILFDRLNHASLVDGARLSNARWVRYKHNSMDDLERCLKEGSSTGGSLFIVTDSLFSMDGDIADLKTIGELAETYNAFWVVDEAHAFGVFGENGRGIAADLGLKPDLITGTFSKAAGGYGGFAVTSFECREWLVNSARPFIFSTALPPATVESALEAIKILGKTERPGDELLRRAELFHSLLASGKAQLLPFESQIVPIIVGDNRKSLSLSQSLFERQIFVKSIRPPTVPPGSARLRISLTLAHSEEDIYRAAESVNSLLRDV